MSRTTRRVVIAVVVVVAALSVVSWVNGSDEPRDPPITSDEVRAELEGVYSGVRNIGGGNYWNWTMTRFEQVEPHVWCVSWNVEKRGLPDSTQAWCVEAETYSSSPSAIDFGKVSDDDEARLRSEGKLPAWVP